MKTLFASLAALLMLAWASPEALARKPATVKKPGPIKTPKVKIIRGPGGKKKIVFEGLVIVGTNHRPHAVYFLRRSAIDYSWARQEKKLHDRIPGALRKSPF